MVKDLEMMASNRIPVRTPQVLKCQNSKRNAGLKLSRLPESLANRAQTKQPNGSLGDVREMRRVLGNLGE
jgi:hypothetical protein